MGIELQTLQTEKNKDQIKINTIEAEIEQIESYQHKSAMVRSRTKLIENEKKPTKLFYAVDKQNQNKKTITKLKNKNRELKTKDEEILKIAQEFYSDLYKKAEINKKEQENLIKKYDKKISNNWHPSLINPFEEKELYQALKTMEKNKSPGKDGIPMEFYITFWHLIKKDLTELVNHTFFIKEELTDSMKTAVISMIPKKKILMTTILRSGDPYRYYV